MFPYKKRRQNYQEFIFLCNLQGLYAFFLFRTNTTIIILVTLVFAHFFIILVHHLITYTQVGTVIGNKIKMTFSTLASNLNFVKQADSNSILLENVPNVTYNYNEF